MTLIDDLSQDVTPDELDRRKFLGLLGSSALAVAMGGTGIVSVKYISPNVLYEADTRVKIGRPGSIAVGTVLLMTRQKIIVARSEAGFVALSAICTHLGCMTRFEPAEKRIFCPCHGSQFDADGHVTGGPAPRPLPRLAMTLEGDQLVVDTRKVAAPDFVLKV